MFYLNKLSTSINPDYTPKSDFQLFLKHIQRNDYNGYDSLQYLYKLKVVNALLTKALSLILLTHAHCLPTGILLDTLSKLSKGTYATPIPRLHIIIPR